MRTDANNTDLQANAVSSASPPARNIFGERNMHYAKSLGTLAAVVLTALAGTAQAATSCVTQNFDTVTSPALPAGWTTTTATGSPATTGWVTRSVGYTDSGANAAWIDDANDFADIALVSDTRAVTVTSGASITFRQSYTLWSPDILPLLNHAFNGGVLEVSLNGGAFADITSVSGGSISVGTYNATLDTSELNPLAPTATARKVWSGNSNGYVTATANLPAKVGTTPVTTAAFRWRLGTEGGGRNYDTYSGWWIDSISFAKLTDVIFADDFDGDCN
jgi:hypothetical protein